MMQITWTQGVGSQLVCQFKISNDEEITIELQKCEEGDWMLSSNSSSIHLQSLGITSDDLEEVKIIALVVIRDIFKAEYDFALNVMLSSAAAIFKIQADQDKKYGKARVDITGEEYGTLTVVKQSKKQGDGGRYFWICECSCHPGKRYILQTKKDLERAAVPHCGCLCDARSKRGQEYQEFLARMKQSEDNGIESFPTKFDLIMLGLEE